MADTSEVNSRHWAVEEVRFVQEAKFSAILPFVAGAIRFHGDSGIRITLEIDDSGVEEVKKLIDWRHGALEVTVRPVPK